MRRTRSAHLHPAGKWKLAHIVTERLVSDAPGVQRVEQSGGGFWGYLPYFPDVDINTYHKQIDFYSSDDIDITNQWRQSLVEYGVGGTRLSLVTIPNYINGHAYAITADGGGSYYQYQDRYFRYPLKLTPSQTWFTCQIRTKAEGMSSSTSFFGWVVANHNFPAADSGYFGLWVYSDASTQTAALRFRSRRQPGWDYNSEQIDLEYNETVTLAFKTYKFLDTPNVTWFDVYVNDLATPVLQSGIRDSLVPSLSVMPTFALMAGILGGKGFLYLNYIKSIFAKR